ncbi:MAG: hypothetical protein KGL95_11235, partial [Patescibacteria group bacterium]|nr:hypothetical protein [Patescibacteria group bacterium]
MSTEKTVVEKTEEFFKSKLASGYPIPTDKPTATIFVKEAMTTLGLKSGNRTKTKEILQKVLEEMNVDVSKMGFSKNISEQFHF